MTDRSNRKGLSRRGVVVSYAISVAVFLGICMIGAGITGITLDHHHAWGHRIGELQSLTGPLLGLTDQRASQRADIKDQHWPPGQLRAIAPRNASRSGHEAAARTRRFSCFPSTTESISSATSHGTSPNRAS